MAPKAKEPEPPPEEEEEVPPEPQTGEGSFMFADRSTYSEHGGRTTPPASPTPLTRIVCAAACVSMADGGWMTNVEGVKMRHGRGVYDDGSKQRYEGEWLNDMMHGRGTFEYASGAKYEGEFVENKYDGYGTFVFANGATYEGNFKDNQFHGVGTFTDAQHVEWKGKFYNGVGPGTRLKSRIEASQRWPISQCATLMDPRSMRIVAGLSHGAVVAR